MSLDRQTIREFKQKSDYRTSRTVLAMERFANMSSYERGVRAERNVEDALNELKNEGKIVHFYITHRYSRKDKKGVDAVVVLLDGTKVERNIKSSQFGVKNHMKKQASRKGQIVEAINGLGFPRMTHEEFKAMVYQNITNGRKPEWS